MNCTCGSCDNKVSRSQLADNLFNQIGNSRQAVAEALRWAEAFKMTAYHFFGTKKEPRRIGSALVMEYETYQAVLDKTYAPHATVVGSIESIL